MDNLIIGSHVSFKKDKQLLSCVEETILYGANAFMFYTGAPQNTGRLPIIDSLTLEGYKLMKDKDIKLENVIVHAPYIVNLANSLNFDFSVDFLTNEVLRCDTLGVKYMVLHPGSAVNLSREEAINNIIKGIKYIFLNTKDNDIMILLETMAGKGNEIGSTFEEIKSIIDGVSNDRLGVCMDTCHLFDSGIELIDFDRVLDEFDCLIGLNKLKCIHINDSKNVLSSHKDRHENIGYGEIGFDNLINIIYNNRIMNVPKILETPYITRDDNSKEKIYPPYKHEIEMIRLKEFNKNLYKSIRDYYKK